jgi:hypothetical protein
VFRRSAGFQNRNGKNCLALNNDFRGFLAFAGILKLGLLLQLVASHFVPQWAAIQFNAVSIGGQEWCRYTADPPKMLPGLIVGRKTGIL